MVAIYVNILFVLSQYVLDTNYGCLQAVHAFLLMVQYMQDVLLIQLTNLWEQKL